MGRPAEVLGRIGRAGREFARVLAGDARAAEVDRGTGDPERLKAEIEGLRSQNERLRQAMRRCTTCEYRLDAVGHDREPHVAGGTSKGGDGSNR